MVLRGYLKTRVLGEPMVVYRHNGGQIFSLPCDVEYFQFTFGQVKKQRRTLTHCLNQSGSSRGVFYVNKTQKYLWRPQALRHLRIHQWYRYYKTVPKQSTTQSHIDATADKTQRRAKSAVGYTHELHEAHDEVDDETNPNFDRMSSADRVGTVHCYDDPGLEFQCLRRENKHFGCVRTWTYNLTTVKCADGRSERDHYYEAILFRSMA